MLDSGYEAEGHPLDWDSPPLLQLGHERLHRSFAIRLDCSSTRECAYRVYRVYRVTAWSDGDAEETAVETLQGRRDRHAAGEEE